MSGVRTFKVTNVTTASITATSYAPSPTAVPIAPVAHRLAAVAVPRTESFRRSIAPPPTKPIPVMRPSMIRAVASGCPCVIDSAAWMNPQVAMATRGKVRRPALLSSVPADRERQRVCDGKRDEVRQDVEGVASKNPVEHRSASATPLVSRVLDLQPALA